MLLVLLRPIAADQQCLLAAFCSLLGAFLVDGLNSGGAGGGTQFGRVK